MVGFGPEDDHFVAELTYNYGIGSYKLGNDFLGITLASSQAVSNAKELEWPLTEVAEGVFETEAPGGYRFYLLKHSAPQADSVVKVTLAVSDLQTSLNYWSNLLGMKIYEKDEEKQRALLGYADNQCKLELQGIKGTVDHAAAFGRIAFSCPKKELPDLEDLMRRENQKILTPLVSLDTPGKATVHVVILADPDGHEICFVGDEAFRELSKVDPEGSKLLDDVSLIRPQWGQHYVGMGRAREPCPFVVGPVSSLLLPCHLLWAQHLCFPRPQAALGNHSSCLYHYSAL